MQTWSRNGDDVLDTCDWGLFLRGWNWRMPSNHRKISPTKPCVSTTFQMSSRRPRDNHQLALQHEDEKPKPIPDIQKCESAPESWSDHFHHWKWPWLPLQTLDRTLKMRLSHTQIYTCKSEWGSRERPRGLVMSRWLQKHEMFTCDTVNKLDSSSEEVWEMCSCRVHLRWQKSGDNILRHTAHFDT